MIISLCHHDYDDERDAGDYMNQTYFENVVILAEIVIQLNLRQDLERKILLEMRGGETLLRLMVTVLVMVMMIMPRT